MRFLFDPTPGCSRAIFSPYEKADNYRRDGLFETKMDACGEYLPAPPSGWIGYIDEEVPYSALGGWDAAAKFSFMEGMMKEAARRMGIPPPCPLSALGSPDFFALLLYRGVTKDDLFRWLPLWDKGSFWWIAFFAELESISVQFALSTTEDALPVDEFLTTISSGYISWEGLRRPDESNLVNRITTMAPHILRTMTPLPGYLREWKLAEATEAFCECNSRLVFVDRHTQFGHTSWLTTGEKPSVEWYHAHPFISAFALLIEGGPLYFRRYDLDEATLHAVLKVYGANREACKSLVFRKRGILSSPRLREHLPALRSAISSDRDLGALELAECMICEGTWRIQHLISGLPKRKRECLEYAFGQVLSPLLKRDDVSAKARGALLAAVGKSAWIKIAADRHYSRFKGQVPTRPLPVQFPDGRPMVATHQAGFYALGRWLSRRMIELDCSASSSDVTWIVRDRLTGGKDKEALEYWLRQYTRDKEDQKE